MGITNPSMEGAASGEFGSVFWLGEGDWLVSKGGFYLQSLKETHRSENWRREWEMERGQEFWTLVASNG